MPRNLREEYATMKAAPQNEEELLEETEWLTLASMTDEEFETYLAKLQAERQATDDGS